jgi:hypothetical protein
MGRSAATKSIRECKGNVRLDRCLRFSRLSLKSLKRFGWGTWIRTKIDGVRVLECHDTVVPSSFLDLPNPLIKGHDVFDVNFWRFLLYSVGW